MTTHVIQRSIEQRLAETIPIECCKGATAEIILERRYVFLGSTRGPGPQKIICSVCGKELKPVTRTVLSPS